MKAPRKLSMPLPPAALSRLAICYQVALRAGEDGKENLLSAQLAKLLKVDETLFRKDMAMVGIVGKPRKGYPVGEIIVRLEGILGLSEFTNAILIGCGFLGHALLRYSGFGKYGLRITAAFDADHKKVGQHIGDYVVLPMEKCRSIIETFRIQVAILAVPANRVQELTDWLVERGVTGIWNFAPVQLKVPLQVVVRNENLAVGLVQLIHHMKSSRLSSELEDLDTMKASNE
ncbi:MAG: redox-sensing transcriptional repressor Rex [Candidatus Riflebacteria bacterium]|nr:redox-sensing transcriptional repressor Rex [Candidatus Riflebacteria bacterium]